MTRHRMTVTITLAPELLEALRRRAAEGRLSLSILVERILVGLEPPVAVPGDQTAALSAQQRSQSGQWPRGSGVDARDSAGAARGNWRPQTGRRS